LLYETHPHNVDISLFGFIARPDTKLYTACLSVSPKQFGIVSKRMTVLSR